MNSRSSRFLVALAIVAMIFAAGCSTSTGGSQCALGGYQCEDNKAYTCSSDSGWNLIQDCSATLGTTCVIDANTGAAQCVPINSDNLVLRYLYVTNSGDNTVSVYGVDLLTGKFYYYIHTINTGLKPKSITIDPTGRFAYVANYNSYDVSAYTINKETGRLTEISGSPFKTSGINPSSIAIDRSSRFLYVLNEISVSDMGESPGSVTVYAIDAMTGALSEISGSPYKTDVFPRSIAIDPAGRFAYVANYGNKISAYTIDRSTGTLSEMLGSPFWTYNRPNSITVDPTGRFVYVACDWNFTAAYAIDALTGALTEIRGIPYNAGGCPMFVTVDHFGLFAYTANYSSNDVSAYTINYKTGELTEFGGDRPKTGIEPRAIAVDPTSRFVYIANEGSNNISAYTVDFANGALTEITGVNPSPYTVGAAPSSIALLP